MLHRNVCLTHSVYSKVHYFNKSEGGGCEPLYDQIVQPVPHKAAVPICTVNRVPDYGVHML